MLRRRVFTDSRSGIVIDNAVSVAPTSVTSTTPSCGGGHGGCDHHHDVSSLTTMVPSGATSMDTTSSSLLNQRRHSLKYTRHITLPEMHQPAWMAGKHEGSTEKYLNPRSHKAYPMTPKGKLHMHQNTWYTDTDIFNNHIFNTPRNIKDYNLFMGTQADFHTSNKGILRNGIAMSTGELNETHRGQKESPLSPSLRRPNSTGYDEAAENEHVPLGQGVKGYHSRWAFKGRDVTAFANLHWEPYWNSRPLYDGSSVQAAGIRSQSRVDLRDQSAQFEVTVPASSIPGNGGQVSIRADAAKNNKNVTLDLRKDVLEIKSKQHVEEFWDRLKYLIEVHRPAVGDLQGEAFKSRFIRNVHDFFVVFQDAVSTQDFQDSYMLKYFEETRPKGMEDLFGIFIEMESNYIHEDHCPRCSLPFATTRYCGEGDENTPFREHRGRWAPHKAWSKEWYEVVERRAEQLWYRAVEDPHFGAKDQRHTQKQAEELLKVYCKTKSRGKAISFLVNLRGSLEFLEGSITITPEMQAMHDALLDSTPHPHLLTNSFKTEPAAAKYLLSSSPRLMNATTGGRGGAAAKGGIIPQSALQFRVDLEMSKFRREQKEEGAVRLPPAGWSINTSPVIEYKADPRTGHITNWRDVKAGIEQSFLDTGVPQESYTSDEIREIAYLTVQISQAEQRKQALREQLEGDKRAAGCKFGKGGVGEKAVVFPDRDAYRVFKITADAFKTFDELLIQAPTKGAAPTTEADIIDVGADDAKKAAAKPAAATLRYGAQIDVTYYGFPNPSEVTVALPIYGSSTNVTLDITAETCRVFSGYEMGQVLEIVPTKAFMEALQKMGPGAAGRLKAGQKSKVVILGVSKEGLAGSARAELVAQELPTLPADGVVNARTTLEGGAIFSLGSSIEEIIPHAAKALNSEIVANFTSITESLPSLVQPPALSLVQKERQPAGRATVIGVRAGQLWVQFDSATPQQATVAVSLGSPISLSKLWNISLVGTSASSTSTTTTTVTPVEPFSWNTPFRNDWAVERLAELKKAPWNRQRYVSLIENKFTPKVKKFGYTQHITQDDFITKEYQDRLTSRQFFNSPQSFEVIPDANVKSVRFSHKDEGSLKLSGLPGADRNEVENGWSKQDVMNDSEVNEVEQALKDISGRRPGNYIKTEAETSSLELNETWWGAFRPGWKGRNAQQMLLHPSERRTEDGSKYAFRGNLPPIGTSYGMADRIREIVDDYSRGFGLGPTNQGPLADQGHFNTLGGASAQASILGYVNPIVRLFDEKISKMNGSGTSIEQQVFDWCTVQQQSSQRKSSASSSATISAADRAPPNPRNLLLDIKEWREAGRSPSVHLTNMLQDLLKQEVAEFNAGVPAGVPKIHLDGHPTSSSTTASSGSALAPSSSLYNNTLSNLIGTSTNNNDIWADVDRFAARSELHTSLEGSAVGLGGSRSGMMEDAASGGLSPIGAAVGTELNGYILTCVVHAATRNSIASSENSIVAQDDALGPACQHTVIAKFLTEVSSKIGKGLDTNFMQNQQSTRDAPNAAGRMDRGNQRKMEHSPKQLILLDELRDILLRLHVSSQITDSIIKGLRNLTSISKDAIPVSDLIAWAGPGTSIGNNNNNASRAVNNTKMGDGDASSAVAPSLAKTLGVQGGASDEGMLSLIAQGTSSSSPSAAAAERKPAAPINPALWNLLRVHDGRALDILVAARQNKQNSVLYDEFLSCVRGVTLRGGVVDEIRTLAGDDSDAFYRGLFERYTDGTYAPSLEEAVTMFTNFLTTTLQPGMESALRGHFFKFPPVPVTATGAPKLDESNRLPMLVKPLPVTSGIHYFDSVRANVLRLHAELEAAQIPNPEVYREFPFTPTSDNLIKPPAGSSGASTSTSSASINILEGKLLNHALGESIQKLGAPNPATQKYWNRLASFQDGALARRLFFGLFSRSMPLIFEYADLAKYVLDDGKTASDAALSRVLPLLPTHTGNTAKGTAESYPTALTKAAGGVHPTGSGARSSGATNYSQNTRSGTGEAAMMSQNPSYNKLRHIYNTDSISPINAGARLASATAFTILDTTHATTGRPGRGGANNMDNDEGFGSGGGASSSSEAGGGVSGAAAYDEQLTVSRTLHSRIANDSTASARDMKELGVVLANDANAQIEMDFKRNAERYWKRIIDGSSGGMLEELSKTSGGGGGGGRGGGGGNRTFTSRGGGGGGDRRGFGSSAPSSSGNSSSSTTVGNDKPYNQRGPYRGGGGGGGSNRSIGSSRGGGAGGGGGGVSSTGGYSKGLTGSTRAGAGRGGVLNRGGEGGGLGNLGRSSSTPAQK